MVMQEPGGLAFERLTAELAAVRQRERELQAELRGLRPRLGYEFNLPEDASLGIIGRLGKARCRAAQACRDLRAAVQSARDRGAFGHRVLAVAAGSVHTVVCTGDAVLSFGRGNGGRLGYEADCQAPAPEAPGSESDDEPIGYQPTPRVVRELLAKDVVAAAGSHGVTLVHTAEGQAYYFGWLDLDPPSPVPRLLAGLEQVVGVAAGMCHLLAWTQAGQLYTWGHGAWGKLGHGGTEDEAAPRLVEGLAGEQVVGADGGGQHSVARTAGGRVYTFGSGTRALGHGQGGANQQFTPRVVGGLAGSRVVAVAAGYIFTAAVTEAGELFTWGADALGHGGEGTMAFIDAGELPTHGALEENIYVWLPQLVAGLAGLKISGVAAGKEPIRNHMLAWTDSGELYSWGTGGCGQLGHASEEHEWSPRRVEGLVSKVVVGAAAGHEHTVVMTRDQEVYTFGGGEYGQLGHGSVQGTSTPELVGGLDGTQDVLV